MKIIHSYNLNQDKVKKNLVKPNNSNSKKLLKSHAKN